MLIIEITERIKAAERNDGAVDRPAWVVAE